MGLFKASVLVVIFCHFFCIGFFFLYQRGLHVFYLQLLFAWSLTPNSPFFNWQQLKPFGDFPYIICNKFFLIKLIIVPIFFPKKNCSIFVIERVKLGLYLFDDLIEFRAFHSSFFLDKLTRFQWNKKFSTEREQS